MSDTTPTPRRHLILGSTLAALVLAGGLGAAAFLPLAHCPPRTFDCRPGSTSGLRLLIGLVAFILALLMVRLARPARKVPWSAD
jgi:hypothetical protein